MLRVSSSSDALSNHGPVDNRYFHAIYCTIMILPYKFVQSQGISCSFKEKDAMLTAERRRSIMQTLQREGKVLASELSKAMHVSEDTIRRDLRELAAAGELQRVHGGALPRLPLIARFTERQQQSPGAKVAIA